MNAGENGETRSLKAKIRLDFIGQARAARLFFRGKPLDRAAEEAREQQVALLRNVPIQGVQLEDIDMSAEVYTVWDEVEQKEVAYAPVTITIEVENIEDLMRFIMREDFRTIEILAPGKIIFNRQDLERMLFKMHGEFKNHTDHLEKRYNLR